MDHGIVSLAGTEDCFKHGAVGRCDEAAMGQCMLEIEAQEKELEQWVTCMTNACQGQFSVEAEDCLHQKKQSYFIRLRRCEYAYEECLEEE